MREFTIYHNPDCGTSRNVLTMLRQSGIEPVVIEYLKTPPDRATLASLIASMGMTARGLLRVKGTPYGELGLDDPKWTDEELVGAMVEHPILINRPIVVAPKGVRLCRPSDLVLELLSDPQLAFTKEEGVSALLSEPAGADDAPRAALVAAGLPVDDLNDPNLVLLRFRLPAGDTVGYGGRRSAALDRRAAGLSRFRHRPQSHAAADAPCIRCRRAARLCADDGCGRLAGKARLQAPRSRTGARGNLADPSGHTTLPKPCAHLEPLPAALN